MNFTFSQARLFRELTKFQQQRDRIIKQVNALTKKQDAFVKWVSDLEATAFRSGDTVRIQNPKRVLPGQIVQRSLATVRFVKRNKKGQLWVYITTRDGEKTRRLPRNLKKA